MTKELPKIPEIIRDKWPQLKFVKVTEIDIPRPMYTIDFIEGKVRGWRLNYTTGFVKLLESLCQDQGCPQHGTEHVCINKGEEHVR